jgi:hypothetical protein
MPTLDFVKVLKISENEINILPDLIAVPQDKINNKIPVAIVQLQNIRTRLQPNNNNIFYSENNHYEIHKIIKVFSCKNEFLKWNFSYDLPYLDCWKNKVKTFLIKQ